MSLISITISIILFMSVVLFSCAPRGASEEHVNESKTTWDMLVGTYTGQGSDGIYLVSVDQETGDLVNKGLMITTNNPSYLYISQDKSDVYCVNESDTGKVSSFKWDHSSNKLTPVSQQPSKGSYPCYIVADQKEQVLAIGNYMTGNVVTYPLKDGAILPESLVYQHAGTGANAERQEGPHAHCVIFDPKEQFMYAVDLGIDEIKKYSFMGTEKLGVAETVLKLEPGDGPRHLVFHPTQDFAFVVNELSSTVLSLKNESGNFTVISRMSTLPEEYSEASFCADIHVSDDGKFLYVSNRGHNSIACYTIGEEGTLTLLQIEKTGGDWPRNFTLSPTGNLLLVANERSNDIVVFNRDKETGLLSKTDAKLSVSKPVCLKF